MKHTFFLFVNIFLLFSLVCSIYSSVSPNLIEASCQKAARSDPNLSYDFCVACLEASPKSQEESLEELVVFSIELTISNATNIASYVKKLLREKSLDEKTRNGLEDCIEIYSDAISTLREAINAFGSNDYEKASIELSSAMDAPTTCEDGVKEKKMKKKKKKKKNGTDQLSPLNKMNSIFFELTAIPLAFMTMFH